jgi:hypothetical protein
MVQRVEWIKLAQKRVQWHTCEDGIELSGS